MAGRHRDGRRAGWKALAVAALLSAPCAAAAMNVSVTEEGRGTFSHRVTIQLSGEIREGDAARLSREVGGLAFGPGSSAHVRLDSPGGSLLEGMAIGRAIADIPTVVTTDVARPGDRPGDCASACVLAFMGGHYRYLREGSRLGVHQFYPDDENSMTGAEGISVGQVLSAEIVDYMAEMRVDPAFFRKMTEPRPEEIGWVPLPELESFNVVTGDIWEQRTEYRNADGFYYLTLWQQSLYGENKLLVSCNDLGSIAVLAYLQPPDHSALGPDTHEMRLIIDGAEEDPASWDLIGTDERWGISIFSMTEDQVRRLERASSFGARLYPRGDDWFFGFTYEIEDASLRDVIEGCRLRAHDTVPPDPGVLVGPESTREALPAEAPALAGMMVLPGRAFAGGASEGPALPVAGFEECQAVCLADSRCRAVTFTPATGLCTPRTELGAYVKDVLSVSALRP